MYYILYYNILLFTTMCTIFLFKMKNPLFRGFFSCMMEFYLARYKMRMLFAPDLTR